MPLQKLLTLLGVACTALSVATPSLAADNPASAIASELRQFKEYCPGERIQTDTRPVPIAPGVDGVVVVFSTPDGGNCFGQPGENSYLLARHQGRWIRLLAAEPGSIQVRQRKGAASDIVLNSIGMCSIQYGWTGKAYKAKSSKGCQGLSRPPSLHELARMIQGN